MAGQRKWQRIILLMVLGYEGLGALTGGGLLVASPDGRYMDLPVGIMHGTFQDFLIPGAILFGLGLLAVAAFFAVWRRSATDWLGAGLALGGFVVWFFVEIVILQDLHWLHAMWGLPVLLGVVVAVPLLPLRQATIRTAWLTCGILSSLLYAAMNVIGALQWPAYSSAAQTVSELSAIGAPTRPLWVALLMLYTLMVLAFGWGIRMAAGDNRRLRVAGTLITIYGALGLVWPFASMHSREVLAAGGGTIADTFHLALGGVTELIYLVALGYAATALGKGFRFYSLATFVALVVFGVLMVRQGLVVGSNQPTPLLGVWERLNLGAFLLWVVVLALVLLARQRSPGTRDAPLEGLAQPA